jgi:hypothetical protein
MSDRQTTSHCPLCEGYTKRIAELEAERDRYRKALERIANYSPPEMMSHKVWRWRINWLRDKARNALDAQKGG